MKHGVDCPKVDHGETTGMLHDVSDDRPYEVDGLIYCGRCHIWLGTEHTSWPCWCGKDHSSSDLR